MTEINVSTPGGNNNVEPKTFLSLKSENLQKKT